jgi:hypothetical protein
MTPVDAFSARPVGSEPAETENVIGDVPPDVCTVWLYALVITGVGSVAVVIASGDGDGVGVLAADTVTVYDELIPFAPDVS